MVARKTSIALGALVVFALLALLWSDCRSELALTQSPSSISSVETPAALQRESAPPPAGIAAPAVVADHASTRQISHEARGAVIVLKDGGPAGGATLSWSPVAPVLLASIWDWDEIDLSWWNGATTFGTADTRGLVTAATPDGAAEVGSVVWIDLLGHEPLFDVLAPDAASLETRRYELVDGKTIQIQVLDTLGQPVDGAAVEQHGAELRKSIEAPAHVPLLFHRTHTTGADGTCAVSGFPGRQAVAARRGDDVSRPVIVDETTDKIVLRILDSFTIKGTVTRPTSPELVGEIVPRVTISSQHGNLWRELGTAVAREGEAWGPLTLPCEPAIRYRAEVHGIGVIPDETHFPAPNPGESVILHLEAVVGISQWFRVLDEDLNPLPEARVSVSWLEDGTWRGVFADARPDGHAAVLGIRPGLVKAVASCSGYVSVAFPLQDLPLPTPLTLSVKLPRGTTMSGRVIREGKPVPDFEITYWPSDDLEFRRSRTFHDRPDGSFYIDDAYVEQMGIVAAAPGSPGSRQLQVDVTEDGVQDLELELVDVLYGTGSVVEKDSGQPISDATCQPYVFGGGGPVSPWGQPAPVNPDGRFNLLGFREGENCVIVAAPGHGARTAFGRSEGNRVDFGVIALGSAVDLRVEIAGATEPGIYRLESRTVLPHGTSSFEPDGAGNLVGWLRGVGVGRQEFRLLHPDASEAFLSLEVTDRTEVLRFPGGGGVLLVELQQHSGPSGRFGLVVEQETEGVLAFQRLVPFDPDGSARLAGLRTGPARVLLRELDKTLASTTATILDGETTLVTMGASESDVLVRVLDGEKDPLPGAVVRLYGTESVNEVHGGLTDEKGQLLLRGINPGRYVLHMSHPSLGLLPDQEVLVHPEEDLERELVLDARATLELLVTDDDVPLPGLTCRLLDRTGRNLSTPVLTSEGGRAAIPRLTAGSYRLSVSGSTVWKLETEVDVQPSAGLHTLEVRRLGDLRLRVLNAEGVPVNEAEVSLVFEPTGEPVKGWIEAGRVAAPGGLATDKHGELALAGLPRGAYAWRCGAAEGSLIVAPGKESLVLIAIQ